MYPSRRKYNASDNYLDIFVRYGTGRGGGAQGVVAGVFVVVVPVLCFYWPIRRPIIVCLVFVNMLFSFVWSVFVFHFFVSLWGVFADLFLFLFFYP